MIIEWKYRIALKSDAVFETVKSVVGKRIPAELKKFIGEHNAATPSIYRFMDGTSERVFGAVLDFNEDESDTDSVFTAIKVLNNRRFLPFGIDPFGNYICMDMVDKSIVLWDHETGSYNNVAVSLNDFLCLLY